MDFASEASCIERRRVLRSLLVVGAAAPLMVTAVQSPASACSVPEDGVNIALGRPTAQSTNTGTFFKPSQLGVDGNTNGAYGGGSVFHTDTGANQWWEVTLPGGYLVTRVVLWNRTDACCQARANQLVISGDGVVLGTATGSTGAWTTTTFTLPTPTAVTTLRVTNSALSAPLHLAEVQVFGCPV